jgi:hypothetical protein
MQIRRPDLEVQREGNDVTQAAFQSPYAHPGGYQQLIYSRYGLSWIFARCEEGEELPPIQEATLGDVKIPALTVAEMFDAGMFLQQAETEVPTGGEYAGVARQGDFGPYGDGIIGRAGCYLLINGTKGHSIHARFFGDAERSAYSRERRPTGPTAFRDGTQPEYGRRE